MNLEFKNVTKNFGIVQALNNISFKVKSGDFVFIVGPSGSGKTTILKLILRQYQPTSGTILLDSLDYFSSAKTKIEPIRRQIGAIFQDYLLIPDKNIEENIALALDIVNCPYSEFSSRIDQVIKDVNLETRRFMFPAQLSGGELQRAALARALSIHPKIILADEPTGNLDTENAWSLIKLLQHINKTYHTTILMTTHNLDIVSSLNYPVINLKK